MTMFIFQFRTAVLNILDLEFIVTTETLDIKDIQSPLIMLCPFNQYNVEELRKLGYEGEYHMFMGLKSNLSTASWTAGENLSFKEMIDKVLNTELQIQFRSLSNITIEKVQFPRYGYCFDIHGNLSIPIVIRDIGYQNMIIFMSDKTKKTYFSILSKFHGMHLCFYS